MASDVRVFTGTVWESMKGARGDTGPAGPSAVSADAGNRASLGADGLIYVPPDGGSVYRTIASETETGTKGDRCYDENWEYRCIATNTWRRWRRFTWLESDPSGGGSTGTGTGSSWRPAALQQSPGHIFYLNGKFVGTRTANATPCWFSTDGITWSAGSGGPINSKGGTSIAYGNGLFATPYFGTTAAMETISYMSTDGVTWTNPGQYVTGVSWYCAFIGGMGGYFFVFGAPLNSAIGTNVICKRSQTGTGHISIPINGLAAGTLARINGMAVGKSGAVAVGMDGTYGAPEATAAGLRTVGGASWDKVTMPAIAYTGICYGADTYVAVGTGNKAAYSKDDGVTWHESAMPSSASWSAIAYGAGWFVATAKDAGMVARSQDGITWASIPVTEVAAWSGIAFGNGRFIAVAHDASAATRPAVSE